MDVHPLVRRYGVVLHLCVVFSLLLSPVAALPVRANAAAAQPAAGDRPAAARLASRQHPEAASALRPSLTHGGMSAAAATPRAGPAITATATLTPTLPSGPTPSATSTLPPTLTAANGNARRHAGAHRGAACG